MKRLGLSAGALAAIVAVSVVAWMALDEGSSRRTAALGAVEPLPEGVRGVLRWRGGFDCEAGYEALDVVQFEGSSYVAREAAGDCATPPAAPWDLLASAGPPGAAEAFAGTYASPDGNFKLTVTNAGITLAGPSGTVTVEGAKVAVNGSASVSVKGANVELDAGSQVKILGSLVSLGGGCRPVARMGDQVSGGTIIQGSPTVKAC